MLALRVRSNQFREATSCQLAASLRAERIRQGISMSRLAQEAGLSQSIISLIERDLRNPTIDTLLRICSVLKVDLAALLKDAEKAALNSGDAAASMRSKTRRDDKA
ncbi:MAG TPA: helix-turn-helix transcriptional regulator [Verrucomicrobiae bacterium]|nr:helix-turn-helix transcriptional regulator [Verrucomicrobiae bacterium]